MANPMARLSTFHATAILFSLFSACSIHARNIATISAGSVAGGGVSLGSNNVGVGVSNDNSTVRGTVQQSGDTGDVFAGKDKDSGNAQQNGKTETHGNVPAGKGSNNGNVQKHGNNSSAPVKQKPKHVSISHQPGIPVPMAKEFLTAHNKIRASANEPPMKWDKSLARYARRWASKRALDCQMIHSFGDYGENIFWGQKDVWTPSQIVESWASEVEYYDKTKNVCTNGQICGHYTQLVWLDSTKLGCAMVTCLNGGMYTICNYNPPGNFVGESPFTHFNG